MKPITIEERDAAAVRAFHRAGIGGRGPAADSPLAKAALRAVERQQQLHPNTDFVAKALGADQTAQHAQAAQVARGREVARAATVLPVPSDGDAAARTRASLAGVGVVDLSGSALVSRGMCIGTSTIANDPFEERLKTAERARALQNDPAFPEAMKRAEATATRMGRAVKAEDLSRALAEVRAERGPQPYTPPPPVTPLLAATAAKATVSRSFSPVPDRFGGRS